MFDPFNDFETAGYLRNIAQEKDLDIVKVVEHELFRANLPDAVRYLGKQKRLQYTDFLEVHRILFKGFYPWAGQDRMQTAPESYIHKGETFFSHPQAAALAVSEGLRLGHDKKKMATHPGEVMGLFAYGHPFLDGNGRTMLLLHSELCQRAGYSIRWNDTDKNDYLQALTNEIATPGKGILDHYLLQFVGPAQIKGAWINTVAAIQGLDGKNNQDEIASDSPAVASQYTQFEQRRGYQIRKF